MGGLWHSAHSPPYPGQEALNRMQSTPRIPKKRRGSLAAENPRWRLLDCRVEEIEEEGERSSIDGGRGGTRARAGSADFRLRIDELYLLNRLEEKRLRPLYRIPTTWRFYLSLFHCCQIISNLVMLWLILLFISRLSKSSFPDFLTDIRFHDLS